MSVFYNGEHSVTFGDKNSWLDWHLVPTSPPFVPLPPANTKYVEIPGGPAIDLTEAVAGRTTYGSRQASFDFIVDIDQVSYYEAYDAIVSYLHGQRMKMTLADDPDHYYRGRFTVSEFAHGSSYSQIKIEGVLEPFRKRLFDRYRATATNTSTTSFTLKSPKIFRPTFECSEPVIIGFGGKTYAFPAGESVKPNLVLAVGNNALTVKRQEGGTGTATVLIEYLEGVL